MKIIERGHFYPLSKLLAIGLHCITNRGAPGAVPSDSEGLAWQSLIHKNFLGSTCETGK